MAIRFNTGLGLSLNVTHIPDIALRALALFKPLIRGVHEMSYQYKSDYIMSDAKFRQRFPRFVTTSYDNGVADMVRHFQS